MLALVIGLVDIWVYLYSGFNSHDTTNHECPAPWPENLMEKSPRMWNVDLSCDTILLVIEQSKALDQEVWHNVQEMDEKVSDELKVVCPLQG